MNNGAVHSLVILIDQFTKSTAHTITYDALSKHAAVITDIRELGEENFKSDVVIFEPAVSTVVTREILEELVPKLELKVHVVYQDDLIIEALRGLVDPIKASYNDINWNFIYAVVNKDFAILEPYQKSEEMLDSFQAVRARLAPDMVEYMDRFRGTYLTLCQRTNQLLDTNCRLREEFEAQRVIGMQTVAGLTELKALLDASQDKCNSYEALLSKSYDEVFGGFYPERPRVLYIKEISHTAGVDTFISILFSVLTQQYKSSVKVIKLVDSSNALSMRYVPNNYVAITDPYNTAELFTNDFLMKVGAFNVMFDILMLNRSGLEYLIVHDMRGSMKTALDPTLIDLRINEISADYAVLGEYDNALSDLGKHCAFPWSYKECRRYTGSQVVKLAGHPTIKAVLDQLM